MRFVSTGGWLPGRNIIAMPTEANKGNERVTTKKKDIGNERVRQTRSAKKKASARKIIPCILAGLTIIYSSIW